MSLYSEDKLDLLRPMVSHLQKLTEEALNGRGVILKRGKCLRLSIPSIS